MDHGDRLVRYYANEDGHGSAWVMDAHLPSATGDGETAEGFDEVVHGFELAGSICTLLNTAENTKPNGPVRRLVEQTERGRQSLRRLEGLVPTDLAELYRLPADDLAELSELCLIASSSLAAASLLKEQIGGVVASLLPE